MRSKLLFNFFVFAPLFLSAQSLVLDGLVQNVEQKPIPFSNVLLLKAADSTFVSGSVTNEEGAFKFGDLNSGNYLLKASYVGYEDV